MRTLYFLVLFLICQIGFSQQIIKCKYTVDGPLIPIAYSNSFIYETLYNPQNFIYANNSETDKLIGYKSETSQFAIAEMHVVTFGRGTNAIFKMWTCKSLDLPPPPWKPIDEYHIFVESSTWITGPDK